MSDLAVIALALSWPISGALIAFAVNRRLQRMFPMLPPDTMGDAMTYFLCILGGWAAVLGAGLWLLANLSSDHL